MNRKQNTPSWSHIAAMCRDLIARPRSQSASPGSSRIIVSLAAAACVLSLFPATAFAQTIANPSFESPALAAGTFTQQPTGSSWTFTGGSGMSTNGSGFTYANPNAPQGTQVALSQGTGSISQTLSSLGIGTSYTVTFSAANRAGYGPQTWDFRVDGTTVKSFDPGAAATSYTDYTATFTATATSHAIGFFSTALHGGDVTVFIDNVRITTPGGAPSAPSGLTASATGNTQINLTWADNSNNETSFKIERKTGSGGTYAQIATPAANATSYSNTGLAASTQYYYRIRSHNASGDSSYSAEANATTTAGPPPNVPSGLAATVISTSQINLAWTDNSSNENIFKIQRKTGSGGTYSQVGYVGTNVTTYSDTALTVGTTYYYRVVSNNTNGDSAPSGEANATTQGSTGPNAPSGTSATAVSTSQINVSWTDNSGNENIFKIQRKTGSGGTYSQVGYVGTNVTTYSDTGLSASTTFYYRVVSNNSNGDSAPSNEANATTQSSGTAPAAPTGLSATTASTTQINLAWTDASSNETGFKIERKTGSGGTYSEIATAAANATSYSSTGLTAATQYYYRVRATNSAGNSSYSNEANATTNAGSGSVPIANFGFEAPAIGSGTYQFQPTGGSWTFASGTGITTNGSPYTGANPNTPQGNQVAFIQTASDIWQTVSGLNPGGIYTLTYSAAQRNFTQPGQTWQILVDGAVAGTFAPPESATAYTDYSVQFVPAASSATITIHATNLNGGDNTAFFDNFRITGGGAPPPGSGAFYMVQFRADDGKTGTFTPTFVYVAQPVAGNHAPVINTVTANATNVAPYSSVNLSVNATDSDGDPLKYTWVVPAGELGWSHATTETWIAPSQAGTYTLQVMVGDGKTWSAGYVNITVNSNGTTGVGQHQPAILSLIPSKVACVPGETITITATAHDIEGDSIGSDWRPSGGTISGSGMSISWTAPTLPAAAPGRTVVPGLSIWDGSAAGTVPACPFPQSTSIVGIGLMGRASTQDFCDTWMPTWASDGNLYSTWQDGQINTAPFENVVNWASAGSNGNGIAKNSWAKLVGNDPQDLMLSDAGLLEGPLNGFVGRFPGANFMYNGTWFYGSYVANEADNNGNSTSYISGNQGILGGFVGFRTSTDFGHTWNEGPHEPANRLFAEPAAPNGKVKFGQMYMVDFGKNQNHSPDGKVYFVSNGAVDPDPYPNVPNLGQHIGDQVYMCRVSPTVAAINDASQYQFFAGNDGNGNATWTSNLSAAVPIADWNNHFGSTTMSYNAPLNKYLMLTTVANYTTGAHGPEPQEFDTFMLESDHLTGPWKMVSYLKSFGPQAYYPNLPSKFHFGDGRTAWLWFGANYSPFSRPEDPYGAGYHMSQQQIRLMTAADLQ